MSDQTTISIMVTLSVAVLAIIGGITNECYKRYQSRNAVAAAMHAEISALLDITFANNTVQGWADIAVELEKGNNIQIPQLYTPEPTQGPVFNAYVDKFGFLTADEARDIILFYEYLIGIRVLLKNLVNGVWESHPQAAAAKAAQIRAGLHFWKQCEEITHRLLPALDQIAKRRFIWLVG